jgi:uncharacterized membrane protein YgcG
MRTILLLLALFRGVSAIERPSGTPGHTKNFSTDLDPGEPACSLFHNLPSDLFYSVPSPSAALPVVQDADINATAPTVIRASTPPGSPSGSIVAVSDSEGAYEPPWQPWISAWESGEIYYFVAREAIAGEPHGRFCTADCKALKFPPQYVCDGCHVIFAGDTHRCFPVSTSHPLEPFETPWFIDGVATVGPDAVTFTLGEEFLFYVKCCKHTFETVPGDSPASAYAQCVFNWVETYHNEMRSNCPHDYYHMAASDATALELPAPVVITGLYVDPRSNQPIPIGDTSLAFGPPSLSPAAAPSPATPSSAPPRRRRARSLLAKARSLPAPLIPGWDHPSTRRESVKAAAEAGYGAMMANSTAGFYTASTLLDTVTNGRPISLDALCSPVTRRFFEDVEKSKTRRVSAALTRCDDPSNGIGSCIIPDFLGEILVSVFNTFCVHTIRSSAKCFRVYDAARPFLALDPSERAAVLALCPFGTAIYIRVFNGNLQQLCKHHGFPTYTSGSIRKCGTVEASNAIRASSNVTVDKSIALSAVTNHALTASGVKSTNSYIKPNSMEMAAVLEAVANGFNILVPPTGAPINWQQSIHCDDSPTANCTFGGAGVNRGATRASRDHFRAMMAPPGFTAIGLSAVDDEHMRAAVAFICVSQARHGALCRMTCANFFDPVNGNVVKNCMWVEPKKACQLIVGGAESCGYDAATIANAANGVAAADSSALAASHTATMAMLTYRDAAVNHVLGSSSPPSVTIAYSPPGASSASTSSGVPSSSSSDFVVSSGGGSGGGGGGGAPPPPTVTPSAAPPSLPSPVDAGWIYGGVRNLCGVMHLLLGGLATGAIQTGRFDPLTLRAAAAEHVIANFVEYGDRVINLAAGGDPTAINILRIHRLHCPFTAIPLNFDLRLVNDHARREVAVVLATYMVEEQAPASLLELAAFAEVAGVHAVAVFPGHHRPWVLNEAAAATATRPPITIRFDGTRVLDQTGHVAYDHGHFVFQPSTDEEYENAQRLRQIFVARQAVNPSPMPGAVEFATEEEATILEAAMQLSMGSFTTTTSPSPSASLSSSTRRATFSTTISVTPSATPTPLLSSMASSTPSPSRDKAPLPARAPASRAAAVTASDVYAAALSANAPATRSPAPRAPDDDDVVTVPDSATADSDTVASTSRCLSPAIVVDSSVPRNSSRTSSPSALSSAPEVLSMLPPTISTFAFSLGSSTSTGDATTAPPPSRVVDAMATHTVLTSLEVTPKSAHYDKSFALSKDITAARIDHAISSVGELGPDAMAIALRRFMGPGARTRIPWGKDECAFILRWFLTTEGATSTPKWGWASRVATHCRADPKCPLLPHRLVNKHYPLHVAVKDKFREWNVFSLSPDRMHELLRRFSMEAWEEYRVDHARALLMDKTTTSFAAKRANQDILNMTEPSAFLDAKRRHTATSPPSFNDIRATIDARVGATADPYAAALARRIPPTTFTSPPSPAPSIMHIDPYAAALARNAPPAPALARPALPAAALARPAPPAAVPVLPAPPTAPFNPYAAALARRFPPSQGAGPPPPPRT